MWMVYRRGAFFSSTHAYACDNAIYAPGVSLCQVSIGLNSLLTKELKSSRISPQSSELGCLLIIFFLYCLSIVLNKTQRQHLVVLHSFSGDFFCNIYLRCKIFIVQLASGRWWKSVHTYSIDRWVVFFLRLFLSSSWSWCIVSYYRPQICGHRITYWHCDKTKIFCRRFCMVYNSIIEVHISVQESK